MSAKSKCMNEKTFSTKLDQFKKSAENTMVLCRAVVNDALLHFEECGDTTRLKRVHDAMPKNFLRRQALKVWAMAFSPLKVEGETWSKDKSDNAVAFNTEGALKVDFWEFAPEKPIVPFTLTDIVKALEKTLEKFHNDKRSKAADENATKVLTLADTMVSNLKGQVYTNSNLGEQPLTHLN